MSGGSFNYLCHKDIFDLMENDSDLFSMKDALIKYGYEDIAKDVLSLANLVDSERIAIKKLELSKSKLEPVFKAVEWHESGDYGKDTMIKILEKYRKKGIGENG